MSSKVILTPDQKKLFDIYRLQKNSMADGGQARPGRKSAAQTPAPAEDRIYGSKKNKKGSASSEKSAKSIKLSPKIIKALQKKMETVETDKVSLSDLKAVYRRGLGAYSKSHRPTITGGVPNTRNAWAMARVNKFIKKANGEKVKAAYVQDDDLMKYEGGGEITNICIEEVINIINSIQKVKDYFVIDKKLVIVFEEELMLYSAEMINYNLLQFVECHDIINAELNINYNEDYKSIYFDLKKEDATIGKFENGGQTKIICVNCMWEWILEPNTSDLYTCHKCGFDNTLFYTTLKETKPLEEIAKKHGVDIEYLKKQLENGKKHEMEEHTQKNSGVIGEEIGETIALHHLEEMPDYYEKLQNIENDDIVSFEKEKPEKYAKYSVWYPEENYDFSDLQEAVDHIKSNDNQGVIRDFDGRRILDTAGLKNVDRLSKYEDGGKTKKDLYESEEFLAEQREEAEAVLFSKRSKIAKFMICNAYIEMAKEKMEESETGLEKNIWQQVIYIWQETKSEIDEYVYSYEEGGEAGGCGCTKFNKKTFSKGGLAYGNSHDKGGIPLKVKDTGQNIEIEGGEGVINKRSMQMKKKVEFQGKQMTPCQVISKINEMGGGVKFNCGDVEEIVDKDGNFE
jgi:hypothetical protein